MLPPMSFVDLMLDGHTGNRLQFSKAPKMQFIAKPVFLSPAYEEQNRIDFLTPSETIARKKKSA